MAAVGRIRRVAGGPSAATAADAAPAIPTQAAPVAPSTPGTSPRADRGALGLAASGRIGIGIALAALLLLAALAPRARAQSDRALQGIISEIRFEGNTTIPPEKLKPKLLSKVGQPPDPQKFNADLKTLWKTNWFSNVEVYYDESPPKSGRLIVTFLVKEMPVLTHVEFRGRKSIRQKELEDTTGLKVGSRADATHTQNTLGQILRLYQDKGYDLAEVSLLEGGKAGDTKVVIQIFEGPKVKIGSINFVGNEFASDATLRTHISTRKPILGLFGKYHRDMLEDDKQKLMEYYQSHGFFEVKVTPVTRAGSDTGEIELTFVVHEGMQYKVRDVIIEGNSKIKTAALKDDLELHSGRPFLQAVRDADKTRMLVKYNEIGCIDTQIVAEPRWTNQVGIVDLVYKIEEGEPYLLGELRIQGNTRTRDKVLRREAVQAGLLPGEVLDKNRIEIFQKRLASLGYFQNNQQGAPGGGKAIEVKIIDRRTKDKPYGDLMIPLIGEASQARMQDPGGDQGLPVPDALPPLPPQAPANPPGPGLFNNPAGAFDPPAGTLPPINVPPPSSPVMPPSSVGPSNSTPVGAGEPPGSFPSMPGLGMSNVGPDRNDPFPNRAFADIVTSVEEAPTGRFMLGVGANSFQGLMGSATIYEKNFDITNFPKSFSDIVNGQAFRGGGQSLTVNVSVGTLINMAQVRLYEPYLFDLPIGGSASGYLFQRLYINWDERRGGVRGSLGRQIGTSAYFDLNAWAEEVDFFGYKSPAPADYLAASGYTQLYAIMPSLRIDNRNNPFMATKGQYMNFSVEQGFGSFTFTKFDAEGRMYIPTIARPDGTGKQFFTLRGHYGIATESTPVYERYFAGNFGSLRGFQYRTVSPHAFGVPTGGTMMAVGSVEYQFPWNAKDTINQIIFTDFGTVTGNYQLNDLRVSVGTGLKVNIPMFGPMPFEFDLAFPVLHQYGDQTQYFNFTVSGFY
jgi:outer membrane protein insertion porin family